MNINNTNAKKAFKKELGQANHFLITILIGLDTIPQYSKENKRLPDINYSTSWNPQNIDSSVARSRHYAIKSSFSWLVDSLDMYLRLLNRKPFLTDEEIRNLLDSEGNSIYKRVTSISTNRNYEINETYYHLVLLAITWRNKLTHYFNENDINPVTRKYLVKNKDDIKNEFRNLNIEETLLRFENSEIPTFKDTASLLSATQKYVASLDCQIINKLNIENYAKNILINHFVDNPQKKNDFLRKDSNARLNILKNILKNYSFDENSSNDKLDNFLNNFLDDENVF